MANNFYGEKIPSFSMLVDDLNLIKEKLNSLDLYSFSKFFILRNNEYNINSDFIRTKFSYNCKKKEEDNHFNTIQGLYILYKNTTAKYVGVSRNIINRIKQHFTGKGHTVSTLVYLIAREWWEDIKETPYLGTRKEFEKDLNNLKKEREIQEEMRISWKIGIIPINESYLAHLTELFLSCELETYWNEFGTH